MSFARLDRRLQFLPLGLFWAGVAGGFHTYHLLCVIDYLPADGEPRDIWAPILLMLLMMAGTCPIAILMGSAMLRRESPWGEWVVNWVITGVVSCAGGVTFFWLAASIWLFSWGPYPASWSGVSDYILGSMLGVALLSFGPVMAVAIASPVAALVSAPLSLLARRLILHRRPIAEPAGGASQPQP